MDLYQGVRDASEPREWGDVISYYQEKYTGSKTTKKGKVVEEWKGKLATDLAEKTGLKRASIMRRFQGDRKEKEVSEKHQSEYTELGETLPPVVPSGGYHIYGTIWVKYSDGECEPREVDEYVEGSDADELASLAASDMYQGLINYYQGGDVGSQGPGWCAEPALTVEAIM